MESCRWKTVVGLLVMVVVVVLGWEVEVSHAEVGTGNFHRGRRRRCTTVSLGGGGRCPNGTVCVVHRIGRPEVDVPHSGYCARAQRGRQCFHNGYYFRIGTTGIPVGDGCNFCRCDQVGAVVCSNTTVQPPCATDPCTGKTCPIFPSAVCRARSCGGCDHDFFLEKGGGNSTDSKVTSLCETPCDCPSTTEDPSEQVCGKDGRDYASSCYADCLQVAHRPNPCDSPCICPKILSPVCGSDRVTYGNSCMARCAFVDKMRPGDCSVVCACPDLYDPVCGSDGKTYASACLAECQFVTSYEPGACRRPDRHRGKTAS